jgi:hypothetical protein
MARSESGPLTRRQRSLARALKPGVAPLRKLILAGEYLPEPATQAFRELKLSPNSDTDWKVLAALLAIHCFSGGKSPGAPSWTPIRQAELLSEVNKRQQKSTSRLSDEDVCRQIARDKNSPSYFRRSPRAVESKGQGLVKQLRNARQRYEANDLARVAWPLAFRDIGRI